MKKSSILSALCTLFLVSFVSGCFITNHVKNSIKGSTKTKGYVVKKVKTPDMIPPSASADDGTGWKLIDFDEGFFKKSGPKGIRIFVVVYFFRTRNLIVLPVGCTEPRAVNLGATLSLCRKKLWELVSISFLSERGKLATSNWSAEKMTACL